ncbi:Uncharacterised protein [Legionella steigerwaltii]|uniref:Ubiquitin-like domain-containing protein n=1 Tax=Legionella steigerwaltii TaxID=460 RepID=A0A378LC20_9GAMM|nr:hypothetical protein [Legionella steigerwaltii]KTD71975.1 hypothetical protein Lstg_2676 [Legionella steigerwaltii]STY21641.1 Uncharacterised protein [Legionella steigerwaltii]
MKLIINKKNSIESITLDLESSTTVNELLLILYDHRGKHYDHFSFSEYQKFISVYQRVLYGDRFKNKLLPGTHLTDYQLEDPCHLTWEEFTENQHHLAPIADSIDSRFLFWQADRNVGRLENEKESLPVHDHTDPKPSAP